MSILNLDSYDHHDTKLETDERFVSMLPRSIPSRENSQFLDYCSHSHSLTIVNLFHTRLKIASLLILMSKAASCTASR